MNMSYRVFSTAVEIDETGDKEVLTWDLFPSVSSKETLHLDDRGLAKVGSKIKPGMILIGKIGKTKAYLTERKPTSLELHALSFEELHKEFAHLWKDASLYVPDSIFGEVVSSECTPSDSDCQLASVRVRLDPSSSSSII